MLAVGPESELDAFAGGQTERWRLADDQLAMPGITDAHLHLMALVLAETQIDLTGLDLAGALAAISHEHARRVTLGDSAGWLLGHGWSMHDLAGWPTAADARARRARAGRLRSTRTTTIRAG